MVNNIKTQFICPKESGLFEGLFPVNQNYGKKPDLTFWSCKLVIYVFTIDKISLLTCQKKEVA